MICYIWNNISKFLSKDTIIRFRSIVFSYILINLSSGFFVVRHNFELVNLGAKIDHKTVFSLTNIFLIKYFLNPKNNLLFLLFCIQKYKKYAKSVIPSDDISVIKYGKNL